MMAQEVKAEDIGTMEELKFQRLLFPREIPPYLIAQVKGRTFLVEEFYQHLEEINEFEYKEGILMENPSSLLFAVTKPDKTIVGYMWAHKNTLDNSLFVNTLSIDKKYWGNGEIIEKAIELLKVLVKKLQISRVFWMTSNAKFYERFGFKRSRNVAMEHDELGDSVTLERKFKEKKDGQ